MSFTPLHLWHMFFVLLAMNGLLSAELKLGRTLVMPAYVSFY